MKCVINKRTKHCPGIHLSIAHQQRLCFVISGSFPFFFAAWLHLYSYSPAGGLCEICSLRPDHKFLNFFTLQKRGTLTSVSATNFLKWQSIDFQFSKIQWSSSLNISALTECSWIKERKPQFFFFYNLWITAKLKKFQMPKP